MSKSANFNRGVHAVDHESLAINRRSDNVYSGSCAEMEYRGAVQGGRIRCVCGREFLPEHKGQKFCDHECYSASLRVPIEARFWSKVDRNHPSGCWLWIAKAQIRGYGQILGTVNGKRRPLYAHRLAWELTRGPIPGGISVLHRCDVPKCCNPDHLFLGTQQDNLSDARHKGRLTNVAAYRWSKRERERLALNNVEPIRTVDLPVYDFPVHTDESDVRQAVGVSPMFGHISTFPIGVIQ